MTLAVPIRVRAPVVGGLVLLLAALLLGACTTPTASTANRDDVAALREAILAMGPGVDPEEAARAARIAYTHTRELAIAYQITDPPLVHNAKVNAGIKPRGLCWHWAEDMEKRLRAENFRTLSLHRAIANSDSRILIDHSTAIIAARGDSLFDGIVLDPWRKGGRLFWSPVREDARYDWVPQQEVFARKVARGR